MGTRRYVLPHEKLLVDGRNPDVVQVIDGWALRQERLANGAIQSLDLLLPGDCATIGSDRDPSASYLQAITQITFESFDERASRSVSEREPNVAADLWPFRSEQRRLNQQIVRLGKGTGEGRIVSLILDIRERLTKRGLSQGDVIPLPLTQQQLADYLGITVVHLNRSLKRLRLQNLIVFQGHALRIVDLNALRSIARTCQYQAPPVRGPAADCTRARGL